MILDTKIFFTFLGFSVICILLTPVLGVECWELGTCNFVSIDGTSRPLDVLLLPFDFVFHGMSLVIMWGLVVGILWLRTQNPQLVGVIGMAMTASYLYLDVSGFVGDHTSEFDSARIIGGTLFLLSVGIGIYHIIIARIQSGPQ